jgi:hypothetical protein
MLSDKQDQKVEGGSTAIQAGGDVHYHGLSVSEVKELCTLFLRSNFPQLREEARQAAEQHVRDFAAQLESRIVNDAASIAFEKFRESDVQAAINDAVQASARKGAAANPILLTTLIAERVSKQSSDYKDIVISEAVNVIPKLTPSQIALLSFVHFVKSITIHGLSSVAALEPCGAIVLKLSASGFNLSESQKHHIQYTGACSINSILGGDIYEALRTNSYSYFNIPDAAAFKSSIAAQAPSFAALLDQFDKEQLFSFNLTSVGQAIAIANISNYLGKLDYAIWLK